MNVKKQYKRNLMLCAALTVLTIVYFFTALLT